MSHAHQGLYHDGSVTCGLVVQGSRPCVSHHAQKLPRRPARRAGRQPHPVRLGRPHPRPGSPPPGGLTDCPRSREPRPPTRTAAVRLATTAGVAAARSRRRPHSVDEGPPRPRWLPPGPPSAREPRHTTSPRPVRREPLVRRADLRGDRPLASSPLSRASFRAVGRTVRPQPVRGSVVNRCGGGWSAVADAPSGPRPAQPPQRSPADRSCSSRSLPFSSRSLRQPW